MCSLICDLGLVLFQEAKELWKKIQERQGVNKWRPDLEEEYEDREGNIYNKKTYSDLQRQGLIWLITFRIVLVCQFSICCIVYDLSSFFMYSLLVSFIHKWSLGKHKKLRNVFTSDVEKTKQYYIKFELILYINSFKSWTFIYIKRSSIFFYIYSYSNQFKYFSYYLNFYLTVISLNIARHFLA